MDNPDLPKTDHLDESHEDLPDIRPDDGALAEKAFPGYRTLFSATFMYVSREQYPLPWLLREIVQNFVDGNKQYPHTLNGITLDIVQGEAGRKIFTITGAWSFEDYSTLVHLGSGKLDDESSAGGNGIGLKQTILRFMRDFNVSRFEVLGEGWKIEYKMAQCAEINEKLQEQGITHTARHGVLMCKASRSTHKGSCSYVIETDDSEIMAGLENFRALAVCDDNPDVRDLDFVSDRSRFRWLGYVTPPIETDITPSKNKNMLRRGKLYVNGQIYRFDTYGDSQKVDYWSGPEGMAVILDNVRYNISLDRPPMRNYEVVSYLKMDLLEASQDQLIQQLKLSEHLWSRFDPSTFHHVRPLCLDVVKCIVEILHDKHNFSLVTFRKHFGEKKYIAVDLRIEPSAIESLESEGYYFCPEIFGKIGIEKVSKWLKDRENPLAVQSDLKRAKALKPDVVKMQGKRFDLSKQDGVEVPFDPLPLHQTAQDLGTYCHNRFNHIQLRTEIDDENKIVRIYFPGQFSNNSLVGSDLYASKEAEIMSSVWAIAHAGLQSSNFSDVTFSQGDDYVSTFAVDRNTLFVRNIPARTTEPHLEIQLQDNAFSVFKLALETPPQTVQEDVDQNLEGRKRKKKLPNRRRSLISPGSLIAAVAVAAMGVVGATSLRGNNDLGSKTSDEAKYGNGMRLDYHIKSRSLSDILGSQRAAKVESMSSLGSFEIPLKPLELDVVEDFEIIQNPPNRYLEQLQVLKDYFYLATGYQLTDKLFVFKGKGAYGIHIAETIGMHEAMMGVSFEDALTTFTHEVAHDAVMAHDAYFRSMFGALNAQIQDTLANIARTPPGHRTFEENALLVMEAKWDRLRRNE